MIKKLKDQYGFTLIELLLVIAVIVALAITVFVALNPGKRLADARDARRTADVDTILTAVHQYIVDNKGALPAGISTTSTDKMLGTAAAGCTNTSSTCSSGAACVDLSATLAPYLKSIPFDPKVGSATTTFYSIAADTNGIVTVKACGAENLPSITSSR
jgi:prepilin-type N-terminal cleavage/methylation domain-containing protein